MLTMKHYIMHAFIIHRFSVINDVDFYWINKVLHTFWILWLESVHKGMAA